MPLSLSSRSPTNRCPWKTERFRDGKAGHTITRLAPSASASASATGPILPSGVESKVEQYLNRNWLQPCFRSQSSATIDCAAASSAGMVRDFSATMPASTSPPAGSDGTPEYCTVRMPPRASVLARSEEPVKSSPMQPR